MHQNGQLKYFEKKNTKNANAISQMIHVPSREEETISRSKQLNCNDATGAVCSFKMVIRFCCTESMRQTRIWPSLPPDTRKLSQLDMVNAEQPEFFVEYFKCHA